MLARAGQGLAALVAIVCIAGCGARSASAQVSNGFHERVVGRRAHRHRGVAGSVHDGSDQFDLSGARARRQHLRVARLCVAFRHACNRDRTFFSRPRRRGREGARLARHAGLTLGEVESIAEGYAGAPSRPDGQALKGSMPSMTANTVQTSLNGPVVIAVVYRVAGGDPGRTISVLGLASDAATPQAFGNASSGQFRININARGSDLKDAAALVERYESLVHKAAAQTGLRDAAITKMEFSFNIN